MAGVMLRPSGEASAIVKPGRNDPCSCGSGKKFKKCCAQGEGDWPPPAIASRQQWDASAAERRLLALINSRRYVELEQLARQLTILLPDSAFVWKALATSLEAQGKDALHPRQMAAELSPEDADAHSKLGIGLWAHGRLEEAMTSHLRAVSIRPDDAGAHHNLGSILASLGRLADAVASYRRSLQIKPEFAIAYINLGNALRSLGLFDEALVTYRRALQLEPNDAGLYNGMGIVLRNLKQADEAVVSLRRAIQIKSDFADAHGNLGNALRDLGLVPEAITSYLQAIEIDPECADFHSNLGNALLDQGKLREAAASYGRAIRLKPDFAMAHSNMGGALRELGQLDGAEGCFRQALTIEPNSAAVHVNLATVLRLQNRHAEAEFSCRRALQIDPKLPMAHVLLATIHTDKGLFAEAEVMLKKAVAIEPGSPAAWSGLVNLRRMTLRDADWIAKAQRIANHGLQPRHEAELRFAIGKYYDDIGDYPQAFANYQLANQLTKCFRESYDRKSHSELVSRRVCSFDQEWLESARRLGIRSSRPLFIVGMPRSGTSLAEQILSSHPAVFGAGEQSFWGIAAANVDSSIRDGACTEEIIHQLARDYLLHLDGLTVDSLRVIDKRPTNFLSLGLIHAVLPDARFIHMRRHPIDTCLSIYFQNFDSTYSFGNDLDDLAHFYGDYERIMEHWCSVLPRDVILDLPYEQLVDDQEGWTRKMLDFVGLEWDPRCLDFNHSSRIVITASSWQVRQRISSSSVERWRNYQTFIEPLLRLTQSDLSI
jgi:tetratricopeptide (TPR) repeat protein